MKKYFRRTLRSSLIIWMIVTLEIIVISFFYLQLRMSGESEKNTTVIAFVTFVLLIILSVVLFPKSFLLLPNLSLSSSVLEKATQLLKLPLWMLKLLNLGKSIPRQFLTRVGLVVMCLYIIGFLLAFAGLSNLAQEDELVKNGILVNANVIGSDCNITCVPVISFKTTDGKRIVTKVRCCTTISVCVLGRCLPSFVPLGANNTNDFTANQKVSIIYNPKNPTDAEIRSYSPTSYSLQALDLLSFGIFLASIGVICSILIILLALIRYLSSKAWEKVDTKNKDNMDLLNKQKNYNEENATIRQRSKRL